MSLSFEEFVKVDELCRAIFVAWDHGFNGTSSNDSSSMKSCLHDVASKPNRTQKHPRNTKDAYSHIKSLLALLSFDLSALAKRFEEVSQFRRDHEQIHSVIRDVVAHELPTALDKVEDAYEALKKANIDFSPDSDVWDTEFRKYERHVERVEEDVTGMLTEELEVAQEKSAGGQANHRSALALARALCC
jgi:hypothetical protein